VRTSNLKIWGALGGVWSGRIDGRYSRGTPAPLLRAADMATKASPCQQIRIPATIGVAHMGRRRWFPRECEEPLSVLRAGSIYRCRFGVHRSNEKGKPFVYTPRMVHLRPQRVRRSARYKASSLRPSPCCVGSCHALAAKPSTLGLLSQWRNGSCT